MSAWTNRVRDPLFLGGVFVFLATQVVYLLTMTISCPFWDSGEFIATSYVLGIPHPPGTPLYVLIGRLFTLIPLGEISARVNYLSALASSMAALFTYLVIAKFVRRWNRRSENRTDIVIAIGGGLVGAFFTAFGRTFWENAIEAEVYALSSFVMIFSVWLVLKWEESGWGGREHNNNLLLLIGYLLFVTIGIHMGTFLVAPPIFIFALMVSPRTVINRGTIHSLAVLAASMILFYIARAAGASVGLSLALSVVLFIAWIARKWDLVGHRNIVFWLVVLAVLGLSVQLFLIVRARLDPPINEADPSTWKSLWLVLSRDQYKPPNPFEIRQAPYSIQFTKHFWRYWHDQYHLGIRPEWLAMALPFFLGLIGAVKQLLRDRKRFVFMLALVFITTVFLVFYLNFKEDEVRDRDYFFVAGYHFFALWIGMGAAALAGWLRGEPKVEGGLVLEPPGGRLFGIGTILILSVLSFFPVKHGWYKHDRSGFLVARDYAYNMLHPLEEDAIIFTNGDNDTFPLWYLQEVEGIRKDVRVVNLSLLNTHWYIRQLRDYEPKVKIRVPDDKIDLLHGYYTPDGDVVLVKDLMVRHILEQNVERPIYLAVTVPDQMELENHLVMEGLAFRWVEDEGEAERLDLEKTRHNLEDVFLYRGLLDEEGYYDTEVYKDPNARKLVQNYVAAWVRIAYHHLRSGDDDAALEALERASRINPTFPGVLYTMGYLWLEREDYEKAASAFRELIETGGDNSAEIFHRWGAALQEQGQVSEAERVYREGIDVHPDDYDSYRILFTLLWTEGRRDEAVGVIESWLVRHPDDHQTREALRQLISAGDSLGPEGPMVPGEGGR